MNETIAFRPEGRASTKDVVVNYTLASLDELEQLAPGAESAGAPVNRPWQP
ncbi:membrane protein [Salmonella enterica subsp. enterica]|uniref:Membrane protein n=1 Tax=Salmonella enterica I TaxID=59201 RepID=A0A379VTM8_SALET|nr:membrane protein [Salmonella enterica subsp. enterica]